ncbi:MAG: peptidoglycan DD-metalloendopeptidase family protein [Drouetiella hepatica Uher 2000/2452]|jgi:murein DD-endopeptidase MepM/ murein hydrolase activator NlpD|uniref:Peptidoglycan DD-metalloendopeptidase family protein n=1 Tax=Drouetiella hepatica Uher 2000/2452 TaxID=904376 RepID=A0A951QAL2_9CYAN|nr:peptidoglycan DD-metalloendopeptidase family protein [Drouetiella hepatica Uher 2000/2452]
MPDFRDNSPSTARSLTLGQTCKDALGGRDRHDYYTFKLRNRSSFNASLGSLKADVELLQDRDRNGKFSASERVAASTPKGKRVRSIASALNPGTYQLRVFSGDRANQTYSLKAAAESLGQFQAKYYGNTSLSGKPIQTEYLGNSSLSFSSATANLPNAANFSARYTTERSLAPGLYHVKITAEDGVRVKVGKQTVVDQWTDQGYTPHSGYFYSEGKQAAIAIEHYDKGTPRAIAFEIQSVIPFQDQVNASQWKATLFSWDDSQSSSPAIDFAADGLRNKRAIGVINLGSQIRSDGKPGISFDWGTDTYVNDGYRLPHDTFALQATTIANFDGSSYTFRVKGDDGFQILAHRKDSGKTYAITPKNQWVKGSSTYQDIAYKLPTGQYDLTFNYFEKRDAANFDLTWEKSPQAVPTPPKPSPSPSSPSPDSSLLWDSPLKGYPATSSYGQRSYWNGTATVSGFHRGIDLGTGDEKPPIEAARKGVVTLAETGWNGGFGNLIEIDHGEGIQTRYAHLSSIGVKQGDRVDSNTVIGYVGTTGNSTGNHLHFEVLVNGEAQNPEDFLSFV